MSFDLNLLTVCNHRIYRELVDLAPDRRSLRVAQPIASSNVEVFASNDEIPSSDYTLIYDPLAINVQQPRMIFLNKKWDSLEDYFEVGYNTLSGFCPKCAGLKTIDDISYDVKGELYTIRNEALLLQNLEKFTVTEIRSNPFHTFIGTGLVSMLGTKYSDAAYMSTKITQEITTSLNVLKDLQDQYQFSGRSMTDGELLDNIDNVRVSIDRNDPTIIRADVTATAKSGKSVDYSQFLRQIR
jgi:hypothetical protein